MFEQVKDYMRVVKHEISLNDWIVKHFEGDAGRALDWIVRMKKIGVNLPRLN